MIISVDDLKAQVNCGTTTDGQIKFRLEAIEMIIRAYTNNNFQRRDVRFSGESEGKVIYGTPRFFAVGDTVQITASVNCGLYVITATNDDYIEVDKELLPVEHNLVTKINYPADVVQCAIDLYVWKQEKGDKVGIKSETLSRHSVTYEDSASLYMGYPEGILNGLSLYRKVRC